MSQTFAFLLLLWLMSGSTFGAATVPIPGHVEGWGNNVFGQATPPEGLDSVIAVAAGSSHSLALKSDGQVVAWGDNSDGQCAVQPNLTNVVAISARQHSVALTSDGKVVVWGSSRPEVTTLPANVTNVVAIAAGGIIGQGEIFTVAVRRDGTVTAWGVSSTGATNVPPGLSDVIDLSAGAFYVLSLKRDGSVIGWGTWFGGEMPPSPGQVGIVAVRAGQFASLGLRFDGTLVKWTGLGNPIFENMPLGLNGVTDVQMGFTHAIALRTNRTVIGWGMISDGQKPVTVKVPEGLEGVVAIAAGDNHDLFITARPRIQSISSPLSAVPGANLTFSVVASGADLSFQWRHRGLDLPGETNATLSITNAHLSDGGTYDVLVRNPFGTVASQPTSLLFPAVSPPTITAQPENLTRFAGQDAAFGVSASGEAPLTYQWLKNGTPMPGATNSTLILRDLSRSDAGSYSAVVTDIAEVHVASAAATLAVLDLVPTGTLSLKPSEDVSIFSSGTNPRGSTLLVGTRGNGVLDRGLLRFNLSSLPAGTSIKSVQLRLSLVRSPLQPSPATFSLYRMLKPWHSNATWTSSGAGATWSAPGGLENVDYSATRSSAPSGGTFGPDEGLLADVREWIAKPALNYGWLIKTDDEGTPRSARHFGSLEIAPSPQLLIEYAIPPIPQLRNARLNGNEFVFALTGVLGRAYRIERRNGLETDPWTTVTNAPANPGVSVIPISFLLNGSSQFYRVVVE